MINFLFVCFFCPLKPKPHHTGTLVTVAFRGVTHSILIQARRTDKGQVLRKYFKPILKQHTPHRRPESHTLRGVERIVTDLRGVENRIVTDLRGVETRIVTDLRGVETRIVTDLRGVENRIVTDLRGVENRIVTDLRSVETRIVTDLRGVENRIVTDLKGVETRIVLI